MKNIMEILVGIPGSGKSTWIDSIENKLVISSDNIIEKIANECGGTYNQHFANSIKDASDEAIKEFHAALKEKVPCVIIDRTNLTVKSRKRWIKAAMQYKYKIIARVFPTPRDEVLQVRLQRPGKSIPDHVIVRMKKTFVMPNLTEGFDEIISMGDDNENKYRTI